MAERIATYVAIFSSIWQFSDSDAIQHDPDDALEWTLRICHEVSPVNFNIAAAFYSFSPNARHFGDLRRSFAAICATAYNCEFRPMPTKRLESTRAAYFHAGLLHPLAGARPTKRAGRAW